MKYLTIVHNKDNLRHALNPSVDTPAGPGTGTYVDPGIDIGIERGVDMGVEA